MNLNGYNVYFTHNSEQTGTIPGTDAQFKGQTSCIIENDNKEVIAQSVARCSVKDVFTKFKGRKLSLTRAISDLPKNVRTQIWQDYWTKTGKGQLIPA